LSLKLPEAAGAPAGGLWMFCNWVCRSWIDLSSLAMRDFNSSTESLSDCTWPETVSSLPPPASFCALIFCCRAFTVAVIWLASSAVCSTRCCRTPNLRVHGGLQALHHVEQLLHLGLQLDDLFRGRVRGHGRGGEKDGQDGYSGGEAVAKGFCSLHSSPAKQFQ
jgi:hypothetical protein